MGLGARSATPPPPWLPLICPLFFLFFVFFLSFLSYMFLLFLVLFLLPRAFGTLCHWELMRDLGLCRLPRGSLVASCLVGGGYWVVLNIEVISCWNPK